MKIPGERQRLQPGEAPTRSPALALALAHVLAHVLAIARTGKDPLITRSLTSRD